MGPAVGDVALGNVSTTERHAQRSDIMDTLGPFQSIGVPRALPVRDIPARSPAVAMADQTRSHGSGFKVLK